MDQENQEHVHPPVEASPVELEPEETKWPKVIGVISLIYAIGGLLCATTSGIWLGLSPMLPMFRGGADFPGILRASGAIQCILTFGVGILMVVGAVSLLRRRRSGPGVLKKWVVLRVAIILLSVVVMVLTGPAQIQMQRSMLDLKNDMSDQNVEKTDDELWHTAMLQGGIGAGVFAIYPVFLGLYLSRKKITAEVEQWG